MELTVIGAGNMGAAILEGLKDKPYKITIIEHPSAPIEKIAQRFPNAKVMTPEVVDVSGKVVLFAIKPQIFPHVKVKGRAKGVISIMAGVNLESLRMKCEAEMYIRSMPNMAALYGKSATAFTGDLDFKEEAKEILEAFGQAYWVDTEKELDVATALAGSGPAYVAVMAEALADGAVNMGLKRPVAQALAQALFEGTAEVLKTEHPALLKEMVQSPGGTTAAGCAAMEEAGVRNGLIKAVEAAFKRARELG